HLAPADAAVHVHRRLPIHHTVLDHIDADRLGAESEAQAVAAPGPGAGALTARTLAAATAPTGADAGDGDDRHPVLHLGFAEHLLHGDDVTRLLQYLAEVGHGSSFRSCWSALPPRRPSPAGRFRCRRG